MWFSDWMSLARIAIVSLSGYAALVLILRVSGKRTLTKMSAFDLVVTVALGSTLATSILSKDVSIAEGALAFAMLVLLQYAVAWVATRSPTFSHVLKSEPTLVFYRGEFRRSALRRERLTEGEVRSAVREHGVAAMEEVEAVVLEASGDLSVIVHASRPTTALHGIG